MTLAEAMDARASVSTGRSYDISIGDCLVGYVLSSAAIRSGSQFLGGY